MELNCVIRVCFAGGWTLRGFLIVYWANDVGGVGRIDDDAERTRDDDDVWSWKCCWSTSERDGKFANDDEG